MIVYILQVVFFQLVAIVFYDIALSKLSFFKGNRVYLIGIFLISFVLPFLGGFFNSDSAALISEIQVQEIVVDQVENLNSIEKEFHYNGFLILYLAGLSIGLFYLGRGVVDLISLWKNSSRRKFNGFTVLISQEKISAFSFFNLIFISERQFRENREVILRHELMHCRAFHSMDKTLFSIFKVLMWFNPIVYLYASRLAEVHEYQTDYRSIKFNNLNGYIDQLLNETFQTENINFVNPFYQKSLIKKRIVMLLKTPNQKSNAIRYVLIIPMLLMMLFVSSCTEEDTMEELPMLSETELQARPSLPFALIEQPPIYPGCEELSKEDTRACLNRNMQLFVKENFDVKLGQNLGLKPGKNRIFVLFTIDANGQVSDVRSRAKHPSLEEEAIKVISSIPDMTPAFHEGERVTVKYSMPIVFNVEE